MLSVMLLGFGSAASAQEANEQEFEFDIPAQPAHSALTEFAEQADLTLVFPDDVVHRKTANALIGQYTLQEGVDILLAGTGLTPIFSNELVLAYRLTNSRRPRGMPWRPRNTAVAQALGYDHRCGNGHPIRRNLDRCTRRRR